MASSGVSLQSHPISIATPSRDSMTFTSTKGLLNGPGQNNCFLNSAVQVLWHLDIFRRSFRDLSGHACMADSCIFCALKELFSQLQYSTETALPPDALRRALAESFFDQNRFQLGFMDDAAECFENMLLRIHMHIAHGEAEDMCNAKHCIPHQKFAMTLVEQSVCASCGATSEPLSYTQMVHYVSTSTLVYQVRTNTGLPNPPDTFGQLLQKAGSMGDVRTCPSACGAVIQIGRTLMNHPEIVSIGLVWNSERPTLEHIMEVFSTIGTTLRLRDVFNTVVDNRWAETSMHNLVGVVTYYGKHYSTFFFHTKLRIWIYFDDATVREVGPRWEQVVEKCRKGRYQPLLLLYALPDGTPVCTENAPKQVTPFYNDKTTKKTIGQTILRRSVTPSPEKPITGNTRRAITPNPESSVFNQKPPLPRQYNEYQNLSVIQKNIHPSLQPQMTDAIDGCTMPHEAEYISKKSPDFEKPQINVHRTLSNGSSSGVEGMCIPEHLNIPRRRDSGNWSGDRNSASSASSTTMENPYLYLIGKLPHCNVSVPSSPTRIKSDSSSGSSGVYDAGYDSYSLSSNDSSSMTTLQHLMKMGHLAKIPEDYNQTSITIPSSQSCDVLCDEADELLVKSRQLEDEHDLVLALALCNAAATKARAAMNAPYNNPQTLTLARMKHNTCIMRARSLHRRMTQSQNSLNKDSPPEIRHTREGSSGSGRHSRQNSRDKSQHSRQNSRELLVQEAEKPRPTKSIEIYATLPKKKDQLKAKLNAMSFEDEEYVMCDKPPEKESRNLFSKNKSKDTPKTREKRSRSEDRNKMSRDLSIAPEIVIAKDTLKKAKEEKAKEEKKDKDGKTKKQHKIRRKLLMGGLIKRKNRSMPDLTETTNDNSTLSQSPPSATVDDSSVGLKGSSENKSGMSGYLSEGHLEFNGNNANPNLERSKLMRKSFHCSAGKILTAAKVPPPPPLRTTSQLSKSKLNGGEVSDEKNERPKYPLPNEAEYYQNSSQYSFDNISDYNNQSSVSLPYYHDSSCDNDSYFNSSSNTVITKADVHHEQSPMKSSNTDSGVDEVDCLRSHMHHMLDLPPYPSPMGSVIHSRQASEDFPPPPPPLDLSALDEHLPKPPQPPTPPPLESSQYKHIPNRQDYLSQGIEVPKAQFVSTRPSADNWLKELQAKQAALKMKKSESSERLDGVDEVNTQKYLPEERMNNSVKNLASKFENTEHKFVPREQRTNNLPCLPKLEQNGNSDIKPQYTNPSVPNMKHEENDQIAPEQIAEEIREVEMLNAAVNKALNSSMHDITEENKKTRFGKKKSVSFCDQVILVATADEQEDDSYIPNPILERVLRSAVNKPENAAIRQEIMVLRENELNSDSNQYSASISNEPVRQSLYARRNSLENLLSGSNNSDMILRNDSQFQQSHVPNQLQQGVCHSTINEPNSIRQNNYQNGLQSSYSNQQHNAYYSHSNHYNGQPEFAKEDNQNMYIKQNDTSLYSRQTNDHQYKQQHNPASYPHAQPYSNGNIMQQQPHPNGTIMQQQPHPNGNMPQQPHSNGNIQQLHSNGNMPQQPHANGNIQQLHSNGNIQQQPHANGNIQQLHSNGNIQQPVHSNGNVMQQNQQPQFIPNSRTHSNNQYMDQQASRQSPYQQLPPNSPSYAAYYMGSRTNTPTPQQRTPEYVSQAYPHPPRSMYNQPIHHIRQSTPSPIGYSNSQLHHHSPSPAPSHTSSTYSYHANMYRGQNNNEHPQQSVYQRVPLPADYQQHYTRNGCDVNAGPNYSQQQHYNERNDVYQRVPPPHSEQEVSQSYQNSKYAPYQHMLPLKQALKKTVSFEPGTKGDQELLSPKPVVTPIIVNNANNSIPTDKTKCNLCRKKNVAASNLYCTDCEFYMSRFKPRS